MSFLRRLFGGRKSTPGSPPASKDSKDELLSTENNVECPHIDLGPHWENAADVGQADKVTGYVCGGCGRTFSVEEAQALRETEATRLAWMQEGDQATETQPSTPPPGATG